MTTAIYTTGVRYPRRLNKRESRVVQTAVAAVSTSMKAEDETALLALDLPQGSMVVRLDNNTLYIFDGTTWNPVTGGGGGGTPGGSNGQVQFNSAGTFGADSNFSWDNTNKNLNLNNLKLDVLAQATLTDASALVTVLTFPYAQTKFCIVEYSIERGTDVRVGHLKICTNGTNVSIDDVYVNTDDVGVFFTATVSGSDVNVKYTTTSTGSDATLKFSRRRWI
jgi:hypothetical protein